MSKKIDYSNRINSANDAFALMLGSVPGAESIKPLPVGQLHEFEGQPFKPYPEQKLQELAGDIAANGVLSPLIVRKQEEGWQILAGHNRRRAAMLAGLEEVPCIVKDVDDDMAALIVVNTNLNQREELLPSEKAFAYKMQLDAMKRQAGRPGENSVQFERNLIGNESRDILAAQTGESASKIQRYIRLTWLVPELLAMVDNKTLPFIAGVNLSYHHHSLQQELLDFMDANEIATVNVKQSEAVKALSEMREETLQEIFGLVAKEPKLPNNPKPAKKVGTVTIKTIERRFQDVELTDEDIADVIEKALTQYEANDKSGMEKGNGMGVKTIPTEEYVARLLEGREYMESKDFPLENDFDFVMSLMVVMDYEEGESPYNLEFLEGKVKKNGYSIPNMEISRG